MRLKNGVRLGLLYGRPDPVNVIVIVKSLQKFSNIGVVSFAKGWELLGDIAEFTRNDSPAVVSQPFGHRCGGSALRDESCAGHSGRDVIVLVVGERLEIVGAGFDGSFLGVFASVGMIGLDDAGMIKQEFIAAWRPELAAFEKLADFRRSPIVVVGQNLHNDRHFVGSIAFENNVFERQFFVANTSTFFDRAFDDVARDAGFARFFNGSEQSRISGGVRPAHFGGDHDFFDEFSDDLTFFEVGDFTFGLEPLATHK